MKNPVVKDVVSSLRTLFEAHVSDDQTVRSFIKKKDNGLRAIVKSFFLEIAQHRLALAQPKPFADPGMDVTDAKILSGLKFIDNTFNHKVPGGAAAKFLSTSLAQAERLIVEKKAAEKAEAARAACRKAEAEAEATRKTEVEAEAARDAARDAELKVAQTAEKAAAGAVGDAGGLRRHKSKDDSDVDEEGAGTGDPKRKRRAHRGGERKEVSRKVARKESAEGPAEADAAAAEGGGTAEGGGVDDFSCPG